MKALDKQLQAFRKKFGKGYISGGVRDGAPINQKDLEQFLKDSLLKARAEVIEKVEAMLKPYKILDNKEVIKKKGLYQGMAPLSEYAYYQDLGYKKAMEELLNWFKNL